MTLSKTRTLERGSPTSLHATLRAELAATLSQGVQKRNDQIPIEVLDFETPPAWFHEGQLEAWACEEQEVLVLSGKQSGKTSFIAHWLLREIQRRGPGDYSVNGPSIELLKKKCLPGLIKVLEGDYKLGSYVSSEKVFRFSMLGIQKIFGEVGFDALLERYGFRDHRGKVSDPEFAVQVTIYIGYARDENSLESATFKAVASDECGMTDFGLAAYDVLVARRSTTKGRYLMATTPYDFGWLKTKIYDECKKIGVPEDKKHFKYCEGSTHRPGQSWEGTKVCIRFESWLNPKFGKPLFESLRKNTQPWKFDLFYRAIFSRPAGAIFDTFTEEKNVCRGFKIPPAWPRVIGCDFGDNNKASFHVAIDPNSDETARQYYCYCTYATQNKSVDDHVNTILMREPDNPVPMAVGGANNENDKRDQFTQAGLYVLKPSVSSVMAGIDYLYGAIDSGRLKIFAGLDRVIHDLMSYSWELDRDGNPTDQIARKGTYHRVDSARYVISELEVNPEFWKADQVVDTLPGEGEIEPWWEDRV